MSSDKKLDELRGRIDALDEQIQTLINARARCAAEVAEVKSAEGETSHYYRPEREAAILRRISERNAGPLSAEEMVRLFREIMSACLALDTLDDVFREVAAGAADYGVVPVENSTEGVISHTLDLFQLSRLNICGEVELRIHHHLLVNAADTQVTRVLAHQQALAQCRGWLEANLPGAAYVAVGSNAEAARLVREDDHAAAIASDMAAELYNLTIKERNIEDQPDNTTRFLVIGPQAAPPSGRDKTSLLVSVNNKPGALYAMLQPIAQHGISMTRIESRPSRQTMWEYVFYIDVDGHREDASVAAALLALEQAAFAVKVLGSYPKAVI
jgi:chorismate mutase/prephenate dehydratase